VRSLEPTSPAEKIFRSTCPRNCYDACSMLTHVRDGVVVKIEADREHPITQGFLCSKGGVYLEYLYSKDRILHPLKRIGEKGEGKFERISWEEAFAVITEKLRRIAEEYGPEAVLYYDFSGTMGVVNRFFPHRFFSRYGSSRLGWTLCNEAGRVGISYVYGAAHGMDPLDMLNSKLIVFWGFNPAWTNIHGLNLALHAKRERGAMIAVVDPLRTETADIADLHVRPKPGTDGVLAYGIMNVLVDEGLYDRDFVRDYTHGFEALRSRLSAFPPSKVEEVTSVPADQVVEFARTWAARRPSCLQIGYGMQRNLNGGEMVRAVSCIQALTGNIGVSGGGFLYSNSRYFGLDLGWMEALHLSPKGRRTINMVKLGEALTSEELRPPIKMLFVFNSNPAAVCPNQGLVRKGLAREDLFTVVHDLFPTDTVDYADLVLPAPSFLEYEDIFFSYYSLYASINEKAIEPLGESLSNIDLFRELAKRMGYMESELLEDADQVIDQVLSRGNPLLTGITREELRRRGYIHLNTPKVPHIAFEDRVFPTPSGKVEFYSERALADGYDPVPSCVVAPDVPGMFRLLTPLSKYLLHSQFHNLPRVRELLGGPSLEISREDASELGIKDGDTVSVQNERGSCTLTARLSDTVSKGLLASYSSFWPKLSPDRRNVNFTTPDRTADMGGNSAYHSNYVKVVKASQLPRGFEADAGPALAGVDYAAL
jgi:anaerobic selenocysteine-containing dehydrogenase